MNAPAQQSASPVAPRTRQLQPGEVFLSGRVSKVRRAGALFCTLLVLPSADSFSSPSTVEVLSDARFGEAEEDVRIICRVGGYRRTYRATDKDTGEQRAVQTADNKLFLVKE